MAINTYTRYRDYSQFQSGNPDTDLNGADLDTDFDRIKTFADAASAAIADVRRDDGQLKNASVGLDQLKGEMVPFLNKAVVFKGDWVTATAYAVNDLVSESSSNYVCLVAHTSGTFATDLAAAKWQLISTTGSTGATGAGFQATSSTSIAVGTGSKSFTTQSGLAYTVGARVRVASQNTSTAWMEGLISAYSGTTLTVEVALTSGGGTHSDWNINPAGEPGTSAVPGHLFGLTLSKDGTLPNTILDIAAGQCCDSEGTTTIVLGSAITKDITAAWAVGDGNGGMGIGVTAAASTTYYVFAIINDGVGDVYIDTDSDGANAPSGTTAFRKIGSFRTDGSSHISTVSASKGPTVTALTSGTSATYTTPAGAKWLRVRMSGGGGGGGGCGATTGPSGSSGGNTVFNSIAATGGSGGGGNTASASGTGGNGGSSGTGTATMRVPGNAGGTIGNFGTVQVNGQGAASPWFGGAQNTLTGSSANGVSASANTGAGGQGAGGTANTTFPGSGGGSGECVELIIVDPAATYTYTVGAGGAGGIGTGTGARTGGAGGSGVIYVEEHYEY